MPRLTHACLAAGLAVAGALSAPVHAKEADVSNDPYAWLEEVEGQKQLDWVRGVNAKAEAEIAATPAFKQLESDIRAILDSDAKIPGVQKIGDYYYNFWKDKQHERGVWRRTTLVEYRKAEPLWETVLDLDALNKAEGENWVWHGANCLRPDYARCLVALSRGGADADVTREFDLPTKTWVEGGFFREEAKGALTWIDRDTVYVYTDFGEGSLTSSGYPRIVKEWKRGTPLASAKVVYEGKADDMYISAGRDDTPGFERDFVSRTLAFYNDEVYLRNADGTLTKIDAPNSANKSVQREWIGLELREPWTVGGRTYKAGSLLAAKFDDFMAGKRDFEVLFEPTDTTSLAGSSWTKHHLVINVLDDVKNRLFVLTPGESGCVGKGWLEQGGTYAVANIRGGGEYGPRWHQAALKQNRHKAYEDFAAVAQDLIARKVTSPAHLGIQGGSNGGLLTGNMLMQYPHLFGAVVVQVPLLDMKRYSHLLAGASWMAEYGDPDTADWDFIQKFSPYHLFNSSKTYPPTLFMTSTRDDRVHPGHARKMMAKMLDAGKDVRYYENIEGGHGGAANNAQSAHMSALAYTFLWQQLAP